MPKTSNLVKQDATFIEMNMGKSALIKAMRVYGLNASKVIKPIVEALEATKVISAVSSGDANGATTDFIDVPDHATRLRAAQVAIELLGLKKDNPTKQKDISKVIHKSLKAGDEVELQRIIFNKDNSSRE